MKLIIASDIHGSAYYCKKLVEVINKENPDRIYKNNKIKAYDMRTVLN